MSSFHNFKFEDDGSIRVWKAFGMGNGRKIMPNNICINHQGDTKLHVKAMFPEVQIERKTTINREDDDASQNAEDIFDYPEQGCNCVFSWIDELEIHLDMGKHWRFINNDCVYDTLKPRMGETFHNRYRQLSSRSEGNNQHYYKASAI